MRIEDLDLDSLKRVDLMMGLEADFRAKLAIEHRTDRLRLEEAPVEIQRCRKEQGHCGEGVA